MDSNFTFLQGSKIFFHGDQGNKRDICFSSVCTEKYMDRDSSLFNHLFSLLPFSKSGFYKKFRLRLLKCGVAFCLMFVLLISSNATSFRASTSEDPFLLETLFASLGVTFEYSSDADRSNLRDSLIEQATQYRESLSHPGYIVKMNNLISFFSFIEDFFDPEAGCLMVPENYWEILRWYLDSISSPADFYPVPGSSAFSMADRDKLFAYVSSIVSDVPDNVIDEFVNKLISIYSDSSGIFYKYVDLNNDIHYCYGPLYMSSIDSYSWTRHDDGGSSFFFRFDGNVGQQYDIMVSPAGAEVHMLWKDVYDRYVISNDSNVEIYNVVLNDKLYDFHSIWKEPTEDVPGEADYGNKVFAEQFDFSIDMALGENITVHVEDVVKDYISSGTLDVLSSGREIINDTLSGDVILPIAPNQIMDDYYSGKISWFEYLDVIGLTAVDTVSFTDLNTGKPIVEPDPVRGYLLPADVIEYFKGVLRNNNSPDYAAYCKVGDDGLNCYVLIYDLEIKDDGIVRGSYPFVSYSDNGVKYGNTSDTYLPDICYASFGSYSDFMDGGDTNVQETILLAIVILFLYIVVSDIFSCIHNRGK